MDVRMMPVNKNDAKKLLVTKASYNHTSESRVTGVYLPYALTPFDLISYNSVHIFRKSVVIYK